MPPAIRRYKRVVAAFVVLLAGAGGNVASSAAAEDPAPEGGIHSRRVIFRPLPHDMVIDAVLTDLGVPIEDGGMCPPSRLRISYEDPGDGWQAGAYIGPLTSDPGRARIVNGIVRCTGSHHAFVGFRCTR